MPHVSPTQYMKRGSYILSFPNLSNLCILQPDSWCSQDLDMIDLAAKFAIMARENKEIKKELCSLRHNLTENLSLLKGK